MLAALSYAGSRAYYALTGGFMVSNITSDYSFDARWQVHDLYPSQKRDVDASLNQEYSYLGKGCQSYVFRSADNKYVLKFIKFQRFRPQAWVNLFTFIPQVAEYQGFKKIKKRHNLDKLFRSWTLAFEYLQEQTGILYVQVNKRLEAHRYLVIRDKLGIPHEIDLAQTEFLLQRRAQMLCPYIEELIAKEHFAEGMNLIDNLLARLLAEYGQGFADNDHALMQNTGVLDGYPIHIDVGQFIYNDTVKSPDVYKKEIYEKTYVFARWLEKHAPVLSEHLKARLVTIIGLDYFFFKPFKYRGNVGKIPDLTAPENN